MTLSSPTPVNADVIVAAGFPARTIVRLSGATGEQIWQSPAVMEQFSNTSPAVGAGLAVVGSNGGHYYAFDLASGELRWQYAADGIVHLAAPVIAGGRVFMAGGKESDHVHAVDAATGLAVSGWPIDLPAPASDIAGTRLARQRAVSSFAAVGGLVVLTTRLDDSIDTDANGVADKYLSRELVVGIDATGTIAWTHDLGRQVTAERTTFRSIRLPDACGVRERRRKPGGGDVVAERAGDGAGRGERQRARAGHAGGGVAGVAGAGERAPHQRRDGRDD